MPNLSPLYLEIMRDRPYRYWPCEDAFNPPREVDGRETLTAQGAGIWFNYRYVGTGAAVLNFPGTGQTGCTSNPTGEWYRGSGTGYDFIGGAAGVISLECVIKPDVINAGNPQALITKGGGTGANYQWSFWIGNTAALSMVVYTQAGADVMAVSSPNGLIQAGRVHHVVGTYNRAKPLVTVYVDGHLVGNSTAATGTADTSTSSMGIAHRADGCTNLFDGAMGHVAIYNYELSGPRVLAHAQAALGRGTRPWTTRRHRLAA